MDLHYLEIFHTVAKNTSYKKASESLHISQPALSIQVKKLESQLGLKLFIRIGNKVILSESGELLYEYTTKIFTTVEEMERNLIKHKIFIGGTLYLGGSNTPGTYILPIVINEMQKQYPSIIVDLHIADTSEITTLVDNGTLDIAVNGGNVNYSSHVYSEKLFDDDLVFVASPRNRLSKKEWINIEDLNEASFVVHRTSSQLFTSFKEIMSKYNVSENISMYFGSIDAIKQAVYADIGISIMPYYSVRLEIERGLLKELKLREADEVFQYPYYLIYNKSKTLSPSAQKFIEVIHSMCANLKVLRYI